MVWDLASHRHHPGNNRGCYYSCLCGWIHRPFDQNRSRSYSHPDLFQRIANGWFLLDIVADLVGRSTFHRVDRHCHGSGWFCVLPPCYHPVGFITRRLNIPVGTTRDKRTLRSGLPECLVLPNDRLRCVQVSTNSSLAGAKAAIGLLCSGNATQQSAVPPPGAGMVCFKNQCDNQNVISPAIGEPIHWAHSPQAARCAAMATGGRVWFWDLMIKEHVAHCASGGSDPGHVTP